MILTSDQIAALRQRNDEELRKGHHAKHGYPAPTIRDLLHTIEHLKKEKKKWQRLAQDRGKTIKEVQKLVGEPKKEQSGGFRRDS